jgi:hypothetical protein
MHLGELPDSHPGPGKAGSGGDDGVVVGDGGSEADVVGEGASMMRSTPSGACVRMLLAAASW